MTTFTQLTSRLKNFLRGWLLVLGLKECLVECATMCVKSEVMLWRHCCHHLLLIYASKDQLVMWYLCWIKIASSTGDILNNKPEVDWGEIFSECALLHTGIPRFMLLIWGHKKTRKQQLCKSRLLSSTKGEENRIEL